MKIILSIVLSIAVICIITFGLKRNNGFFNHGYNLGETNYLTPAAAAPVATDTTKKAEPTKEEGKAEEPKKEEAGEKAAEGGK